MSATKIRSIEEWPNVLQRQLMCKTLIDVYMPRFAHNLHIILEDGNYDDNSINSCKVLSDKSGDYWGSVICMMLLELNVDDRKFVVEELEVSDYFMNQ